MAPLPSIASQQSLSEEERTVLLRKGIEDPGWFLEYFFPRWFTTPLQWFHCGLLALLTRRVTWLSRLEAKDLSLIIEHFVWSEDPDNPDAPTHPMFFFGEDGALKMECRQHVLVMMPRGFGKTSVINGAVVWTIVYQCAKFLLLISKTANHAEMQLDNVKKQFEMNQALRLVFGDLQPAQREGKWREDFIECRNGIRVSARGRGAQIRGMLSEGERPDFVAIDDLEDRDTVATPEQREKTHEFVYSDLIPAMSEIGIESRLVATGTLLHAESVLVTLRRDPQFATIVLRASYGDKAIWPSQWPLTKLDARKKAYQLAGMLHKFYLEYHNLVRSEETAKFKRSQFIYMPAPTNLRTAIALDPAISTDPKSDFAAIGVVGIGDDGLTWILDVWLDRTANPDVQLETFFSLAKKYRCEKHGIESIGFQRSLVHTARQWMFRKGYYFEVEPIMHGNIGKEERVEGVVQPRYAAGYMRHAQRFPLYETQLLDWPNGKKDGPDAVAMAITLLDPYAFLFTEGGAQINEELPPIDEVLPSWRKAV